MRIRILLLLVFMTGIPTYGHAAPADRQVFFGDLHIHTAWSFDGYAISTRATPEDAYRFARGEAIQSKSGDEIAIGRPLDFMAVTDHAEYMGVLAEMARPDSPLSQYPLAGALTGGDPRVAVGAVFQMVMGSAIRNGGKLAYDPLMYDEMQAAMREAWKRTAEIADEYYAPGKLTTFAGFEWSSTPTVSTNLHRNVLFRDTTVLPERPYSMLDSNRPEDLWAWMETQRDKGATLLAIPHNANMSEGHMFPLVDSDGEPLSRAYMETRSRNEPVTEVVQIKGQSMVHPDFAPDEEYAGFEIYEANFVPKAFNFFGGPSTSPGTPEGSYVRPTLLNGLQLMREKGLNPYELGFIGSSDIHSALSMTNESTFLPDPGAISGDGRSKIERQGTGGVAGVWAEENTREDIFDALARKEAFATSGPRIQVRFFGTWETGEIDDLANPAQAKWAYEHGVPMGQRLPARPADSAAESSPTFFVWAKRDPDEAAIERVHVIKGWLDEKGETHTRVYDVATPAGDTDNAHIADTSTLQWTDPDFVAGASAFYYVRVLQVPTPRWSTFVAEKEGWKLPDDLPRTIQERAWSSPIWYYPTSG